jgi:hypothetical protein
VTHVQIRPGSSPNRCSTLPLSLPAACSAKCRAWTPRVLAALPRLCCSIVEAEPFAHLTHLRPHSRLPRCLPSLAPLPPSAWSSAITCSLSIACPHVPPALPSPSSASASSLMMFFRPPPLLRCASGRRSRLHAGSPPRAASGRTEAICGCAQTPRR